AALFHLLLHSPAESLLEVRVRNLLHHIDALLEEEIECRHIGSAFLHLEAQKTRTGPHIDNALAVKILVAQVVVDVFAKVPLTRLKAVARQIHGVIKGTLRGIVDKSWRLKTGRVD